MPIKLGSTELSDIKLGSTDVEKVMKGTVEVWSRGVDCIDLPAASAAFIEDPDDYTRRGVSYNSVSSVSDGIFPDGPRPFIGAHNAAQSRYQGLGDNGFTVIGSTYTTMCNLNRVNEAARLGMKVVFPFRDYSSPLDCNNEGNFDTLGAAGQDLLSGNSTKYNALKTAFSNCVSLVTGDATANNTVIAWSSKIDDALSLPTYQGYPVTAYHEYARNMFENMYVVDPKSRGCVDFPQKGYAYRNFADVDYGGGSDLGGWQYHQSIWSAQIYWQDGVDISKGATKSFSSRATHVETVNRMYQLDTHVGAHPTGKLRRFIPLIWLQSNIQSGTSGYTNAEQQEWRRNTRTSDILSLMMAGSDGFNYFGWNPEVSTGDWPDGWFGFSYTEEANVLALIKELTDENVISALLWGERKAAISKVAETSTTYTYWIEKSNELCGPCASPRNCSGTEAQSCGYTTDMILWEEIQFQSERYLIMTNMLPNPDVVTHWNNNGSNIAVPSSYSIRSRFTGIPTSLEGLEVYDVITGQNAETTGEYNRSAGTITVTLNHAESRVYKFRPAPGFCGGNEPSTEPPVIGTVQNQSGFVGRNVTFTVSATNAPTSYQWYEDGVLMAGKTASSLTLTNVQLAQSGTLYKATATNAYGTSADSNSATLTVTAAPVELVVNGDGSNGTTGWTAHNGNIANVGGKFLVTNVGGNYCSIRQEVTGVEAGKQYTLTYTIDNTTNCEVGSAGWGSDILSLYKGPGPLTVTQTITATSSKFYTAFFVGNNTTGHTTTVYNISIQEA